MINTELQSILRQIDSGALDEHFSAIKEAISQRKDVLDARLHSQLRRGQTVWFNERTRPTYLIGQEAEVVEINRVRVSVKLKSGQLGRFSGGPINTSVGLLTTTKP